MLGGTDDSKDESDRIISYLYGIEKTEIYLRLFDGFEEKKEADEIVRRRADGEPLEYIIGKTVFCGLEFSVTPDCLIPQADTECVVDEALRHIGGGKFLDLCTGSGCIAVTIAKKSGAFGSAVDISQKALEIAKLNAEKNDVSNKIKFVEADIMKDADLGGEYDLIVSNPPYIRSEDISNLPPEVGHEPVIALDGGRDGLDFYRRIASIAPKMLKKGGTLVLEIGYDEAADVGKILSFYGFSYSISKDFGGNDRTVVAHLREHREET